jgi:hypothetical protein
MAEGSDMDIAAIQEELRRRKLADNHVRGAIEKLFREGGSEEEIERASHRIGAVDMDNTAWLKQLVAEHGWPRISQVGAEAAGHAWLLVQHSDHDKAFQNHVLSLMEPLVELGEVGKPEFAYLTDRTLRGEGKPQRYGTQCRQVDGGGFEIQDCEDTANLDARRAEMSLKPIADYLEDMRALLR